MISISPDHFHRLLPLACSWATEQEGLILQNGVKLDYAQTRDAEKIGVIQPGKVRLLKVERIPRPKNMELRVAAEATKLLSPYVNGITFRYGIYVRAGYWGERELVVHELVHTRQYEQMGGFEPFLQKYLTECLTIGYPENPMEQEARRIAEEICGSKRL
jgi:hypothetical protein